MNESQRINLTLSGDSLAALRELCQATDSDEKRIMTDALSLYKWALDQHRLGRSIGSLNGTSPKLQIELPFKDIN